MLILLPAIVTLAAAAAPDSVTVTRLQCEYLTNPLGIDARRPRLSWVLESPRRGARQTAYQIEASTREGGEPDLWDSGKVASSQSVHVVYAGKPLQSSQRAHWRVRVWDEKDQPSPWSERAWWEMGLLDASDWKAQWISSEPQRQVNPAVREATWIWRAEGDPKVTVPDGERYFRRGFELSRDVAVKEARLLITADDEFDAIVNGKPVGSGKWPTLSEFDLTGKLEGGPNAVAVMARNLGGSAGLIAKLTIKLADGETQEYMSDKSWKVLEKAEPGWPSRRFDDAKWPVAAEVTKFGGAPWGQLDQQPEVKPAPHLRKEFNLDKPVREARIYVCGLGYYELHLNEGAVEDYRHVSRLQPGYTRYDRRVLYNTYDVKRQLERGLNAIGVVLGNGWYNLHPKAVWNFDKAPWRSDPVLRVQLDITFEDGSRRQVVSDESWKWCAGPILSDGLFVGEVYDARKELPGWNRPGYNDTAWSSVFVRTGPAGRLVAQAMPPIRDTGLIGVMPVDGVETGPDTLRDAVRVTEPTAGVYVFDMGQNFAGVARLNVRGAAGTTITLKYGERLNKDGTVDQRDINAHAREGRFQTDRYILKGDPAGEHWAARFGYYGFQYVEVSGLPQKPDQLTLQGIVRHTDYEHVGRFECSNPLLNEIYRCTLWSYGANYHGIPTDCPHREKNGWTGDAHLAAEQAMYNFNNVAAYEKWMNDFKDEQRESGELPGIVPTSGWGYNWGNGPAWDSAYLLIPWYLYEYYGDVRVLEEHYEGMKRYVDYLTTRAKDHIVSIGLGDWVPVKERTPVEHTSTAYYYVDAMIVSKAARLLGKSDDADRYAALAAQIRKAYRGKLAGKDGLYTGTQTALSCVLYQGLATDEERGKLVDALVANVRSKNDHLDCGILGTKYLLHALTDNGHADLAYAVASQSTYPSWGAWIRDHGATTLWESWDGAGSRMHIMLGDVVAWFYKGLGGIYPDPDRPGFEHFFVRPNPVGDLTNAGAAFRSIRGLIESLWERKGNQFTLDLTVPPNTTATLSLPARSSADVKENGQPPEKAEGIQFIRQENGRCVYEIQSGQYGFESVMR